MTQPGEDLHQLDEPRLDPGARDPEAPEADAFEQAFPADPTQVPDVTRVPLEANEADAAEQARVVELDDEDDYR